MNLHTKSVYRYREMQQFMTCADMNIWHEHVADGARDEKTRTTLWQVDKLNCTHRNSQAVRVLNLSLILRGES